MGNYAIPEEIRKLKPKGSVVKKVNDDYYVYAQKHVNDETIGKWKIKSGSYLGKSTLKEGFIPSSTRFLEDKDTVFEFGQYTFAYLLSLDTHNRLRQFFDVETADKIYMLSLIHLVNGFSFVSKISSLYNQSFFPLICPKFKFGQTSITTLYQALGSKRERVDMFEKSLYDESSNIAIDGHCISSSSKDNDLAKAGNKANKTSCNQMNLIMGYDIDNGRPVLSDFVSGNQLDKISIDGILETKKLENVMFIVDKGFFSTENLDIFTKNNCHYIMPIQQNLKDYKQIVKERTFVSEHFVYKTKTTKSVIFFHKLAYEERYLYAFRDLNEHALECDDYLEKIKLGKEKYTEEQYKVCCNNFGTLYLMSSKDLEPLDAYTLYKKRWTIETYYNHLKNHLDFDALHLQDYYVAQGIAFIIFVTSVINYEIEHKILSLKPTSLDQLLLDFRSIKLRKDNGIYHTTSTTFKRLNILNSLGVDIMELLELINNVQKIVSDK